MNLTKTSHVNGTITFSEEERETFQKAYSIIGRVAGLMNELDNHMDNFDGCLNYEDGEEIELSHFEEIFDSLETLKSLGSIYFEYDEP